MSDDDNIVDVLTEQADEESDENDEVMKAFDQTQHLSGPCTELLVKLIGANREVYEHKPVYIKDEIIEFHIMDIGRFVTMSVRINPHYLQERNGKSTTDQPSFSAFEDATLSFVGRTDARRDADTEVNKSDAESDEKPRITEDSFSTGMKSKRNADNKGQPVTVKNIKRRREVKFIRSSTVDDETSTASQPSSRVKKVKRSLDNGARLAAPAEESIGKRSVDDNQSSVGLKETRAVKDSSLSSTSEVTNSKRHAEQSSCLTTESSDAFNGRAIGSVGVETTTDEQPSSSTEIDRDGLSSTMDCEMFNFSSI